MKFVSFLNEELAYVTRESFSSGIKKEKTTLFYKKETGEEELPVSIIFLEDMEYPGKMELIIPNNDENYGDRYKGNDVINKFKDILADALFRMKKGSSISLNMNKIDYIKHSSDFPRELKDEINFKIFDHYATLIYDIESIGQKLSNEQNEKIKDKLEKSFKIADEYTKHNIIINKEKGPLVGEETSFRRIILQLIKEKFDKNSKLVLSYSPSNDTLDRIYLATLTRAKYNIKKIERHDSFGTKTKYEITKENK